MLLPTIVVDVRWRCLDRALPVPPAHRLALSRATGGALDVECEEMDSEVVPV